MNINDLTIRLTFSNKEIILTPDDPFKIFERMAKIYLQTLWGDNTNYPKPVVVSREKTVPTTVTTLEEWRECGYNPGYRTPLRYIKWIYQEVPREFWKFNNLITMNLSRIKETVKKHEQNEIWIDMKGIKNKMKCVKINEQIKRDIQSGTTYLPSYEQISAVVPTWGDYIYKYGQIKKQLVSMKGGEKNEKR